MVRQVLGADAVVGAREPGPEVGEGAVDPRKQLRSVLGIALGHRLMVVGLPQRGVSLPAIRQQDAPRLDRSLDERYERSRRDVLHHGEPDPARSPTAHLNGADEDGLRALALSATAPPFPDATDVRLVHVSYLFSPS